jgi:hypothetical protein
MKSKPLPWGYNSKGKKYTENFLTEREFKFVQIMVPGSGWTTIKACVSVEKLFLKSSQEPKSQKISKIYMKVGIVQKIFYFKKNHYHQGSGGSQYGNLF